MGLKSSYNFLKQKFAKAPTGNWQSVIMIAKKGLSQNWYYYNDHTKNKIDYYAIIIRNRPYVIKKTHSLVT